MRYCFSCRHITSGKPLFCNYCGKSYDIKLCPRLHVNPRQAETCSRCGSRDMSLPQRHVSWFRKLLYLIFSVIPGIVLLFFSILYVGYFLYRLVLDPNDLLPTMLLGLVLGLLWLVWIALPVSLSRMLSHRQETK